MRKVRGVQWRRRGKKHAVLSLEYQVNFLSSYKRHDHCPTSLATGWPVTKVQMKTMWAEMLADTINTPQGHLPINFPLPQTWSHKHWEPGNDTGNMTVPKTLGSASQRLPWGKAACALVTPAVVFTGLRHKPASYWSHRVCLALFQQPRFPNKGWTSVEPPIKHCTYSSENTPMCPSRRTQAMEIQ